MVENIYKVIEWQCISGALTGYIKNYSKNF